MRRGSWRIWAIVGTAAGAAVALQTWQRHRARRSSPLSRPGETRSAVVTGASSGIGRVYAEHLAHLGYNLVLVARREERLRAIADGLRARHGVSAQVVVADLSDAAAVSRLAMQIKDIPDLTVLVNNAGFGLLSTFAGMDATTQDAMIHLHVTAAVHLTRAALPGMLARNRGAIVNVSSLVVFYPLGGSAMYAGTKSYLKTFTEALHQELHGTGVRVQALCPGFTRTEFPKVASIDQSLVPACVWMDPSIVVAKSLHDLDEDRVVSVPGLGYRLLASASPFVPRALIYGLGAWVSRRRLRPAVPQYPKRTYQTPVEALDDLRYLIRHREQMGAALRVLDPSFRHRLLLAVTQVNQCRYCAYVHTRSALVDGMCSEEVTELMDGVVDHCPPDEVPALLYAQHWAEQRGYPDEDMRAQLLALYGQQKADAIEMVLRTIKMGNYGGNAFDGFLYWISRGRWGSGKHSASA